MRTILVIFFLEKKKKSITSSWSLNAYRASYFGGPTLLVSCLFFFFFKPIFSTLEDFIGIKYHMYESIIFLVLDHNNDIGTFHYAFSHWVVGHRKIFIYTIKFMLDVVNTIAKQISSANSFDLNFAVNSSVVFQIRLCRSK